MKLMRTFFVRNNYDKKTIQKRHLVKMNAKKNSSFIGCLVPNDGWFCRRESVRLKSRTFLDNFSNFSLLSLLHKFNNKIPK